jgi:phage N-6-adenine-methyltransferase
MAMPQQKPGRSMQDYQTPENFLAATKLKVGVETFAIDLAADEWNSAADLWYDEAQDSLKQPWYEPARGGWAWLNPPFGKLEPWVKKACTESLLGRESGIAMLVPAAVGSNWWRDWVHDRARVLLLNGRLTFVGQPTCYPKDCCLLLYGRFQQPGYEVWTWPLELTPSESEPEE